MLQGYADILSLLYTDRITVYRYSEKTNADGSIELVADDTNSLVDIPCRISLSGLDNAKSYKEDVNPEEQGSKIFCDSSVDLRKGDKVTISRYGIGGVVIQIVEGTLGRPFKYPTHQEINLIEVGEA